MKYLICITVSFLTCSIWSTDLITEAANFICDSEKKNNLKRLAIFSFTDGDGEETDEGQTQSTIMLSKLATCENLILIDKSKEQDILKEQALSQSGAIEEKTMTPAGQMIGADSLLFGIYENAKLELRLLDAKTGQLLDARLFTQPNTDAEVQQAAVTDIDQHYYTKRWLVETAQTDPPVYLYITSDPAEWNILSARYPYLSTYYQSLPAERQSQLTAWRQRIHHLREINRLPARHVREHRQEALHRWRTQHSIHRSEQPGRHSSGEHRIPATQNYPRQYQHHSGRMEQTVQHTNTGQQNMTQPRGHRNNTVHIPSGGGSPHHGGATHHNGNGERGHSNGGGGHHGGHHR